MFYTNISPNAGPFILSMEVSMVQVVSRSVVTTLKRTKIKCEIPNMPECWDNQEDWEDWCNLMAMTYRHEYRLNWTLQDALQDYCIDCVPGIFQNMMIKSGRCKNYTVCKAACLEWKI